MQIPADVYGLYLVDVKHIHTDTIIADFAWMHNPDDPHDMALTGLFTFQVTDTPEMFSWTVGPTSWRSSVDEVIWPGDDSLPYYERLSRAVMRAGRDHIAGRIAEVTTVFDCETFGCADGCEHDQGEGPE